MNRIYYFTFFLIVHLSKPWLNLSITTNKNIRCATVERCTNSAYILTYLRFWWHSPGEFYWFVEYMSHVKWIRLSKECRVQVISYAKDHKIIKRCIAFHLLHLYLLPLCIIYLIDFKLIINMIIFTIYKELHSCIPKVLHAKEVLDDYFRFKKNYFRFIFFNHLSRPDLN